MPSKRPTPEKEKDAASPAPSDPLADIVLRLERIETALTEIQAALNRDLSPYVKGDREAAKVAGFKSPAAFRRWAQRVGIRPQVRGGLNRWDRAALIKGES